MTELPISELKNHFNKKIILREGTMETKIEFTHIHGGWIHGFNHTNKSSISVILNSKQDEHSPKYFLIN